MAPFGARSGHTALSYNGRMYVIGGRDNDNNRREDVWSSDNGADWRQETPFAFRGRSLIGGAVFNNEMVIVGTRSHTLNPEVWVSQTGMFWQRIGGFTRGNDSSYRLAVMNGTLFFTGVAGNTVYFTDNVRSGWQSAVVSGLPVDLHHNEMVVLNNRLLVLGGESGGAALSNVYASPDGVNWTDLGEVLPNAMRKFSGVYYEGKIYIYGGADNDAGQATQVWSSVDGENWVQVHDGSDLPGLADTIMAVLPVP